MEHGTAVTRTLSSGAIGSGARIGGKPDAAYDFSTERRHSSAGLRALLWATGSARSLGSFSCLESHSSKDNVHANILTPGSVPRFTIPSLSVRSVSLQPEDGGGTPGDGGEGDTTDEGLGLESTMCSLSVSPSSLSSRSFSCSSDPGRPAHRSVSDPLAVGRRAAVRRESSVPYLEDRHCPDPASRAALSLPHLEKVTTPLWVCDVEQEPSDGERGGSAVPATSAGLGGEPGEASGRRLHATRHPRLVLHLLCPRQPQTSPSLHLSHPLRPDRKSVV